MSRSVPGLMNQNKFSRRRVPNLVNVKVKKPLSEKERKIVTIAGRNTRRQIMRNIESKMWDGQTSIILAPTVSNSGLVLDLYSDANSATRITQGVGDAQYVGTHITPTHLMIRLYLQQDDSYNVIRAVVIQWIGGVTGLTAANIFQSVGTLNGPLSPFDRAFEDEFRVLKDKLFYVDSTTFPIHLFKLNVNIQKLRKSTFSDAAGTLESGALFLVLLSDSAVGPHPNCHAYWRLHYKDA